MYPELTSQGRKNIPQRIPNLRPKQNPPTHPGETATCLRNSNRKTSAIALI